MWSHWLASTCCTGSLYYVLTNHNVSKSTPTSVEQSHSWCCHSQACQLWFFWQYHCWNCGEVFCKRCIDKQCTLPGHYSDNRVPVCKSCYKLLKKFKWDAAFPVSYIDKHLQEIWITLQRCRGILVYINEWQWMIQLYTRILQMVIKPKKCL